MFGGAVGTTALADTWEPDTTAPASVQTLGADCAGSAGAPALDVVPCAPPWLGDTLRMVVTNAPAATVTVLLFAGASDRVFGGSPLPLALAPFGLPGCSLLVSLDAGAVVPAVAGRAVRSLPVPSVPAAVGASVYLQAFVPDPPANAAGLVVTNATRATVGTR